MTSSEIFENIRYYENLKEKALSERRQLYNNLEDLEILRRRLLSLQDDFVSKNNVRKQKLQSVGLSGLSISFIPKYIQGMNSLLGGNDYNKAINGIDTALKKTAYKIDLTDTEVKKTESNIAQYDAKICYWHSQLQYAQDSI